MAKAAGPAARLAFCVVPTWCYTGTMKRINLRLEDDLHAQLKESAREDDRSMQQQIVWLLKGALNILHPVRKEQK